MTNPAPVEPFNGKPASSLQGTDISPAQAYKMTNLDKQIRSALRIAKHIAETGGDGLEERQVDEIKALIATQVQEARIYEHNYIQWQPSEAKYMELQADRIAQLRSTK